MKILFLFNFVIAICLARPDGNQLTSNRRLRYEIESIKPSIHIGSFSLRTEVPLNQDNSTSHHNQSLKESYVTPKPPTISSPEQSYTPPSSSISIQQPLQSTKVHTSRAYLPPVSAKQTYNAPIETINQWTLTPPAMTSTTNQSSFAIQTFVQRPQSDSQSQQSFVSSAPIHQANEQNFMGQDYLPPVATQQERSSEVQKKQNYSQQSSNIEQQKPIQDDNTSPVTDKHEQQQEGYLPSQMRSYSSSTVPNPVQVTLSPPVSVQQFLYVSPAPEKEKFMSNQSDLQSTETPTSTQQSFVQQNYSYRPLNLEQKNTIQEALMSPVTEHKEKMRSYSSSTVPQPVYQVPTQQSFVPQSQRQQHFVPQFPSQAHQSYVQPSPSQESFLPPVPIHLAIPQPQAQQSFVPEASSPIQAQQSFNLSKQMRQTFVSPASFQQSFQPMDTIQKSVGSPTSTQQLFLPQITAQGIYTPQKSVQRTYLPPSAGEQTFISEAEAKLNSMHPETIQSTDAIERIQQNLLLTQQSITKQPQPPQQSTQHEYSQSSTDFDYQAFVPPPPLQLINEKNFFDSSRDTDGYLPPIFMQQHNIMPNNNQQSYSTQTPSEQAYSSAASMQAQNTQKLSHLQQSYSPQESSFSGYFQSASPIPTVNQTQQDNIQFQKPEHKQQTNSPTASIQHYYSAQHSIQQPNQMEQSLPKTQSKDSINFDPSKMHNLKPFFVVQLPKSTQQHQREPSAFEQSSSNIQSFSVMLTKENVKPTTPSSFDAAASNNRASVIQAYNLNSNQQTPLVLNTQQSTTTNTPSDGFYNYESQDSIPKFLAPAMTINFVLNPDSTSNSIEGQLNADYHQTTSGATQFESQMSEAFGNSNTIQQDSNPGTQYGSNGGYIYRRK